MLKKLLMAAMFILPCKAMAQVPAGKSGIYYGPDNYFIYNTPPKTICLSAPVFNLGISTSAFFRVTSSSDPAIVKAEDNDLTPLRAGKVTITITFKQGTPQNPLTNVITFDLTVIDATITKYTIDKNFKRSCDGGMLTYSITPANPDTNVVYQWRVNKILALSTGPQFASSTLKNGDVLKFTMTLNDPCYTVVSDSIVVGFSPISLRVTGPAATVCMGAPVTLTAQPVNLGNVSAGYQWRVNGVNLGRNSAVFTSTGFNNNDTVDCVMTYSFDPSCVNTFTTVSNPIAIKVKNTISPQISIASSAVGTVCQGTPITFVANATNAGSGTVFQWMVNSKNVGTNNASFTSSLLNNNDVVACSITTANCTAPVVSAPDTVTLYPEPSVKLPVKVIVYLGKSIIFKPTVSGNIVSYKWQPDVGLSNPNIASPIVTPVSNLTYTLVVTNDFGCQASATETIKLIVPIVVPNTFTPNGDGVNDKWNIPALIYYPACVVKVYDRQGSLVYYTKGYNSGWDGTAKGKPLPIGTYYYIIDANNDGEAISGSLAIIR